MLKKEKPTILATLWQQLQETLQIKPFNSKTMVLRAVKSTGQTYLVTVQQ